MVLVGVAAAVVGVSFMSFTRTGSNKETLQYTAEREKLAELAQHRLELILKEKKDKEGGFPDKDKCDGVKDSQCGPDPCLLDDELQKKEVCSGEINVNVEFTNVNGKKDESDGCWTEQAFEYCEVKVTVDNKQTYYMRLYNY
jgi:hypothetical protein